MTQLSESSPDPTHEIKDYYRKRATSNPYATSPDSNLRELEIEFISRYIGENQRVLDVGCGNGYSTLCFATKVNSDFTGVDFVAEMIPAAESLKGQFALRGAVEFRVGDVTRLDFEDAAFDTVISQRCLLNLPSRERQWHALSEVARVLKPGGHYLMLEGTLQGLEKLNIARASVGLEPIPEADAKTNWFSKKFDEDELIEKIPSLFSKVVAVHRFGTYYFLSRVVHPLLVAPEQPRYDAPINSIARKIALQIPDFEGMGHVALWVLQK